MTQTFSLRTQYIADIPWDRTPTFIFTKDSDAYIEAFRKAVDLIPYENTKISFYDDIWDFNPYMSDVNHSIFHVSFEGISDETLKNYYKFFSCIWSWTVTEKYLLPLFDIMAYVICWNILCKVQCIEMYT